MFHGERLELLDGLLIVREPQGTSHAAIVSRVGRILAAFGVGWHARVHAPIALDDESEPEPDVAVVAGTERDYLTAHPSMAALIVEVADSSSRVDRRLKTGLYARARLPEYWIVNMVDGVLEVYREPESAPGSAFGAIYGVVEVLQPSATVTPLAASTARIAVADLLP